NSRLSADLGVEGDDAEELMEAYAKEFRVDMSGFNFLKYFDWEVMGIIPAVVLVAQVVPGFRRAWRRTRESEREITIRHLATCVDLGRWVDPVDSPRERKFRLTAQFVVVYLTYVPLIWVMTFAMLGVAVFGPIILAIGLIRGIVTLDWRL